MDTSSCGSNFWNLPGRIFGGGAGQCLSTLNGRGRQCVLVWQATGSQPLTPRLSSLHEALWQNSPPISTFILPLLSASCFLPPSSLVFPSAWLDTQAIYWGSHPLAIYFSHSMATGFLCHSQPSSEPNLLRRVPLTPWKGVAVVTRRHEKCGVFCFPAL